MSRPFGITATGSMFLAQGQKQRVQKAVDTCARKVRYPDWEAARVAGLLVSLENPRSDKDANAPTPYFCDQIGGPHYHVGHLRFRDSSRRKSRS